MASKKENNQPSERAIKARDLWNELNEQEKIWVISQSGDWLVPYRGRNRMGPPKMLFPISRQLGRCGETISQMLNEIGSPRVELTEDLLQLLTQKKIEEDVVEPVNNIMRDYQTRLRQAAKSGSSGSGGSGDNSGNGDKGQGNEQAASSNVSRGETVDLDDSE